MASQVMTKIVRKCPLAWVGSDSTKQDNAILKLYLCMEMGCVGPHDGARHCGYTTMTEK